MVACTRSSVSRSTAAVASSRTRTCVQGRQVSAFAGRNNHCVWDDWTLVLILTKKDDGTLKKLKMAIRPWFSWGELWPSRSAAFDPRSGFHLPLSPAFVTFVTFADLRDFFIFVTLRRSPFWQWRSESWGTFSNQTVSCCINCRLPFLTIMKLIFLIIVQGKW